MRRVKRRRNKKQTKVYILVAILLFVIVFVCATGYAYLSQRLSLNGTANIDKNGNPFCELNKFKGYQEFNDRVSYEVYSINNGVYDIHAIFNITNLGTKNVDTWRAYFSLPEDAVIKNYYNAEEVFQGDAYIFEEPNNNYNNVISPGNSISFDIEFTTTYDDYATKDVVVYGWESAVESKPSISAMSSCLNGGTPDPLPEDPILADINITSNWNLLLYDYYGFDINITNTTDSPIKNWYVIIDVSSGSMTGCWSASCSQTDSKVRITGPSWGNTIAANSTSSISFQARVPKGYKITVVEAGVI